MTARDFARELGHALRRDTPAFGGTARDAQPVRPKCEAIDGALNIPCGFPAEATTVKDGRTRYLCSVDAKQAVKLGWDVTEMPEGER